MTRRNRPSLAEFVRRHLDPEPEGSGPSEPELEPAPGRQRRRARTAPPDFTTQVESARRYVGAHCRLWDPALVDVKRTRDGAALLFRARDGAEAAAIVGPRGAIRRALEPREYRQLRERVS